jgi:hypothetical protein
VSHIATNWAFAVRGIPPMAKLVLIALADRHNKDTNLCCPDQKMIAADVCMSDRTVRKFVAWLEEHGLISKRIQSKGIGVTTYYTLHLGVTEALEVETKRKSVPKGKIDQTEDRPTGTSRSTNRKEEVNQTEAAFRNKGTVSNRNQPYSVSNETAQGDLLETPSRERTRRKPESVKADRLTRNELQKAAIFSIGLTLLKSEDVPDQVARKFLGGLIKRSSVAIVHAAVNAAAQDPPIDGRGYLSGFVEKRARAAGLRKPGAQPPGAPTADLNGNAVDWHAAVARFTRSGIWPKALGGRPDEFDYRGPLEALEAVFASGRFGPADKVGLKNNIDRLRAARAA